MNDQPEKPLPEISIPKCDAERPHVGFMQVWGQWYFMTADERIAISNTQRVREINRRLTSN